MRIAALAFSALLVTGGAAFAATGTAATATPGTAAGGRTFASQSEAARSCGASSVVWANTRSKAYHLEGDKYFGHTKHGAWMCMGTAKADGFHQAGMKSAAK